MFGSPYYPAGVTDELIDRYFGEGNERCSNCEYHCSDGTCRMKENSLDDDYTEEDIENMTMDEYNRLITVDDDDCCDDWEPDETHYPPEPERE